MSKVDLTIKFASKMQSVGEFCSLHMDKSEDTDPDKIPVHLFLILFNGPVAAEVLCRHHCETKTSLVTITIVFSCEASKYLCRGAFPICRAYIFDKFYILTSSVQLCTIVVYQNTLLVQGTTDEKFVFRELLETNVCKKRVFYPEART